MLKMRNGDSAWSHRNVALRQAISSVRNGTSSDFAIEDRLELELRRRGIDDIPRDSEEFAILARGVRQPGRTIWRESWSLLNGAVKALRSDVSPSLRPPPSAHCYEDSALEWEFAKIELEIPADQMVALFNQAMKENRGFPIVKLWMRKDSRRQVQASRILVMLGTHLLGRVHDENTVQAEYMFKEGHSVSIIVDARLFAGEAGSDVVRIALPRFSS